MPETKTFELKRIDTRFPATLAFEELVRQKPESKLWLRTSLNVLALNSTEQFFAITRQRDAQRGFETLIGILSLGLMAELDGKFDLTKATALVSDHAALMRLINKAMEIARESSEYKLIGCFDEPKPTDVLYRPPRNFLLNFARARGVNGDWDGYRRWLSLKSIRDHYASVHDACCFLIESLLLIKSSVFIARMRAKIRQNNPGGTGEERSLSTPVFNTLMFRHCTGLKADIEITVKECKGIYAQFKKDEKGWMNKARATFLELYDKALPQSVKEVMYELDWNQKHDKLSWFRLHIEQLVPRFNVARNEFWKNERYGALSFVPHADEL